MKKGTVYFKNLDAIRFIAAAMVFLQHSTPILYSLLNIKNPLLLAVMKLTSDGVAGVSFFFVLSGFLITYLLISEYELNLKVSLSSFYLRRVLRIWPLYFAVVAFSFGMAPIVKLLVSHGEYNLSPAIGYYLSFLSNFDVLHREELGLKMLTFQRVTWSVSIEEQFYLFWPLIFAFLNKRYWVYVILTVITGSIGFRILHHGDGIYLSFHTFSVLLDLGIGGLVAYLIKMYEPIKIFFEKTSTGTHLILFVSAVTLLLLRSEFASFEYGNALSRLFVSCIFALIIASQALTKSQSKLNLSNLSFATRWGKYTYGIYLLHTIVMFIIENVMGIFHLHILTIAYQCVFIPASFIFTLIISHLSYTYYESWFLRLKKRFEIVHT